MEDAKTSNQEYGESKSSFNCKIRQVNVLVWAFRLGKHFNRFQWHLKWGVFTGNLSINALAWNHLELLLAELVKLHPSDSSDSPVKQIRSWRDEIIAMLATEYAAEAWQSGIDEITKAAHTGTTDFQTIRSYFSLVFEVGDRINELLRSILRNANTDDASGELAIASFDLGAGLDMAVMPPLNDLDMQKMILQWDEMRNPPATICGHNDPALPPWISTKVDIQPPDHESPPSSNITSDVIRTALDPYSLPVSEISRLKSFCKLLGISDELPRFKGTIQAREESHNDVISKIENELSDKYRDGQSQKRYDASQCDQSDREEITDAKSNHSSTDSSPPGSIDDTTKNNDNNSTDEATHTQSDLAKVPVNTSEKPDHGQSHSTLADHPRPNDHPHLTDKLKPDPSKYQDKKTEDRDRWIYDAYHVEGKSLIIVFNSLKRIYEDNKWVMLSDKTQVSLCANKYAARKNLPIKKRRLTKE